MKFIFFPIVYIIILVLEKWAKFSNYDPDDDIGSW